MAEQVAALQKRGVKVTIVSSGAIGAGLRELNLPKRPTDLAKLQAVAAVGQRRLMDVWAAAFEPHGLTVAQILLTRDDIDHRTRFLNLRNTIHAIHELGAIPIINENDTVSTDELVKITFGDNDILAALVTHALRADLLVLLTVVDGILDADGQPRAARREHRGGPRTRARGEVGARQGRDELQGRGRPDGDRCRRGDDRRQRAKRAHPDADPRRRSGRARCSCPRRGRCPRGTAGSAAPARRDRSSSTTGCAKAVAQNNRSLLPAGIVKVEGASSAGDVVAIHATDGRLLARGLSNYAAADVERDPRQEDGGSPIPLARSGLRRSGPPRQPRRLRNHPREQARSDGGLTSPAYGILRSGAAV